MKKTTILFALMLAFTTGFSQTKVRLSDDGSYVQIKKDLEAKDEATGRMVTMNDGKQYPIFRSAGGKFYIIRTSKAGNQYKQYLKIEGQ